MASTPEVIVNAKEIVKESLLGHEETDAQPQPETFGATTHALFERFAHKDAETGELLMSKEEFVDAIAPADQDYVSQSAPFARH